MDTHDDSLFVHGVVAPDRSQAIFAMVLVGSLDASPGDRLRFRLLDPHRSCRLRPLLIGSVPSGLQTPDWWGGPDYPAQSSPVPPSSMSA